MHTRLVLARCATLSLKLGLSKYFSSSHSSYLVVDSKCCFTPQLSTTPEFVAYSKFHSMLLPCRAVVNRMDTNVRWLRLMTGCFLDRAGRKPNSSKYRFFTRLKISHYYCRDCRCQQNGDNVRMTLFLTLIDHTATCTVRDLTVISCSKLENFQKPYCTSYVLSVGMDILYFKWGRIFPSFIWLAFFVDLWRTTFN